jgi:glycosyltransferase involved in cell wall biosynthesis
MQCGVPVVCTANSSLLEVGGEAAVFAEPNAESLAPAITTIMELSPHQREQKIQQGKTWANTFTWKKTAKATFDVYKEILQDKK